MPRHDNHRHQNPQIVSVGSDDYISEEALAAISKLPCDGGEAGSPPPSKRVRKSVSDLERILVLRTSLAIKGQFKSKREVTLRRDCMGPYIKLTRHVDKCSNHLHTPIGITISPRGISKKASEVADSYILHFSFDTDSVSPEASFALAVADKLGADSEQRPGSPWADVSLEMSIKDGAASLVITLDVFWNNSPLSICIPRKADRHWADQTFAQFALPSCNNAEDEPSRGPRAFYDAAFVPKSKEIALRLSIVPGLYSTLYPFQARTVHWLLQRERVVWKSTLPDGTPQITPLDTDEKSRVPLLFSEAETVDGRTKFYISRAYPAMTTDPSLFLQPELTFRGGLLAEEMGLGKTIELISLILLHTLSPNADPVVDPPSGKYVRPTGATLIVAPNSLRRQWAAELKQHAPSLRVMMYRGVPRGTEEDMDTLVNRMAECDVVLATFSQLSSEIVFAEEPPSRPRRHERKYPRKKSPLMQLLWWRICVDEAQMIESGVSKAATLAAMIPRVNAWAVTGTPVRDDIDDLYGLLRFLRYEPFASYSHVWKEMVSKHRYAFRKLFNTIALRHTKSAVKQELEIPPQRRFVITMPFNVVEEQHYQEQFEQLVTLCGLNSKGEPIDENWDPNDPRVVENMRKALDFLRQTALHPQVRPRLQRTVGNKAGPMRTVEEVLSAMIDQHETSMRFDRRLLLITALTRGQLLENTPRVCEAQKIWERVRDETRILVGESRSRLENQLQAPLEQESSNVTRVGDEKDTDNEDGTRESPQIIESRRQLRYWLEILHKAVFFCANAYFQIKSDPTLYASNLAEFQALSKLEEEHYSEARQIRKELLQTNHKRAEKWMRRIQKAAEDQSFVVIPCLEEAGKPGIETNDIYERLAVLFAKLNENACLIDDWREEMVHLILKPLVDEDQDDNEATGEEFAESANVQDVMLAYLIVLKAAIEDRMRALTGQRNQLVYHDTRLAVSKAKNGEGPVPEKLLALMGQKTKCGLDHLPLGSIAGLIVEIRGKVANLRFDARHGERRSVLELKVAESMLKSAQEQLAMHRKITANLEKEASDLKDALNARIEFYRQMQLVSDSVNGVDKSKERRSEDTMKADEKILEGRLQTTQSKLRYLLHLKATDAKTGHPTSCIICTDTIMIGVLTVCGHQFCKGCIKLWFAAHRNCPVCKRRIETSRDLHDITFKPQELKIRAENNNSQQDKRNNAGCSPKGVRKIQTAIYKSFNDHELAEIRNIDLEGPSFTTKVNTLVRHLIWLRSKDPGCKSVVFSQYSSFLEVVVHAFDQFHISYASMDRRMGGPAGSERFKDDNSIEVFLLHARSHSSGLNLVNANHVFLCEPILNTALELQAIARVDRIGQRHDTTVWLYIVEGTVEESIYELSVKKRMEHMDRHKKKVRDKKDPKGKSNLVVAHDDDDDNDDNLIPEYFTEDATMEEGLVEANSMELEEAKMSSLMQKASTAGETVPQEDLWQCLFGHVELRRQQQKQHNENYTNRQTLEQQERRKREVARLLGEAVVEAQEDGPSGSQS